MARDALGVVAMTDTEACLVSLSDWIGALAEDVARSEGIVPPDRHRMVNFFMRTWLAEHGPPAVRAMFCQSRMAHRRRTSELGAEEARGASFGPPLCCEARPVQ